MTRQIGAHTACGGVELDAPEQPPAAHLAHERMSGSRRAEPLVQVLARRRRGLDQPIALDHLERGQAGRASQRSAAKRSAVQVVSLERPVRAFPKAPAGDHHRDWREPTGKSLGQEEHVRLDALLFAEKEAAAATQARLDFIEDEQRAVASAEPGGVGQVSAWRRAHSAFALHRLEDDGGNIATLELALERS